jgi:hypothetical protein
VSVAVAEAVHVTMSEAVSEALSVAEAVAEAVSDSDRADGAHSQGTFSSDRPQRQHNRFGLRFLRLAVTHGSLLQVKNVTFLKRTS